jgi:hypothetical protein
MKIPILQLLFRWSKNSVIFISLLFTSFGCTDKNIDASGFKANSFHIFTSNRIEKRIYESRSEKFDLGFYSSLYYGNKEFRVDNIKVRGQSALRFRRKSFYVHLDKKLPTPGVNSSDSAYYSKFILSAMPMDFTYIENKISQYLLAEVGLWSLKTFYTELYLNKQHQGIYLFVEDPKEYAFRQKNATVVIRRSVDHLIDQITRNSKMKLPSKKVYIDRFNSIYEDLKWLKGESLYRRLSEKMNLENYMRKIAVDEILENGDYTDEIFFYSNSGVNEKIKFDILPWDYDDVFNPIPHEIGRKDFLCGNSFGLRVYPTLQDLQNERQGRLLFSLEDDLDYVILKDDYLYSKYLKELESILQKLDNTLIDQTFEKVHNELLPFYNISEVIEQSKYDKEPTDLVTLTNNLAEKKERITNRLNWLRSEVAKQLDKSTPKISAKTMNIQSVK